MIVPIPAVTTLPVPVGAIRYLLQLAERHGLDRAGLLGQLRHQAQAVPDDHRLSTLAGIVALDEPLPVTARGVSG